MVEPHAVLQVADGILDLGMAAMVGLQFQSISVPVGDEAVIAVVSEKRQLGTVSELHSAYDEPHRRGVGLTVEGHVGGLRHVGDAVQPVRDGRPVRLRYGLDEIAQAGVLADGDGEADLHLAADGDRSVVVEAAVGVHRELTRGSTVAHRSHGFTQEVSCVSPAPAQSRHEHIAGSGPGSPSLGQQRVIAPLASVAVMTRLFLGQAVGLAAHGSPNPAGGRGTQRSVGAPSYLCKTLTRRPPSVDSGSEVIRIAHSAMIWRTRCWMIKGCHQTCRVAAGTRKRELTMALKKSQLYSSLWQSCDELRGGMDASQYKDYILTLLFMKYISDKYAEDPDALIDVPEGGGFSDMVALKGNVEIGDKINKIISKFAEANDLKGVVDQADFNDENKLGRGKEMQDRLSKLVAIFEGLDFSMNRAHGDDLLGDAYEYLMRNFATESGKSKGQFYTPAEVSRIMAKVVGIGPGTRQDQTIYDPTCGSGSLLIRAADEAPNGITIYGQEMDNATWSLAKMNTLLHGHPTAELWQGNTLADPYFKNPDSSLKIFDFAVANPPFSDKAWSTGLNPANDEYRRFGYGVPPPRNGDYAYMLHLIASLKSTGKAPSSCRTVCCSVATKKPISAGT